MIPEESRMRDEVRELGFGLSQADAELLLDILDAKRGYESKLERVLSGTVDFVGEWANMESEDMPLCFDNDGCGCPRCRARRFLQWLEEKGLLEVVGGTIQREDTP